ncbi:SIR2 family NAD-dependent protein deacylase [Corallococcus macrosporus]|nr:SIR2 family protein [Corallococcus macrosporus]
MANIRQIDFHLLDSIFDMQFGYVLNFTNATMAQFFATELNIDIDNPLYQKNGSSKAKRLKCFLLATDDPSAVRVLNALWEYRESLRQEQGRKETVPNAHGRLLELINRLNAGPYTEGAAPVPAFKMQPGPQPLSRPSLGSTIREMEEMVKADAHSTPIPSTLAKASPPVPLSMAATATAKVAATSPDYVSAVFRLAAPPSSVVIPSAIEATTERLVKMLSDFGAVVWVGAGASQAAGYPGTAALLNVLRQLADDPLPPDGEFTEVVDAFVTSMGTAALAQVLEQQLGKPRPPTAFHRALARLVKIGIVRTIITTNYDPLLETSFHDAEVHVTTQVFDENFTVVASPNTPRLFKVHGDLRSWSKVILSGHSYEDFSKRYKRLEQQLDLLREQHAFVFVGCSMQDPRILEWLHDLGPDRRKELKPWRALMLQSEWDAFVASKFDGHSVLDIIQGAHLRPLIGLDRAALQQLWVDAAAQLSASRAG